MIIHNHNKHNTARGTKNKSQRGLTKTRKGIPAQGGTKKKKSQRINHKGAGGLVSKYTCILHNSTSPFPPSPPRKKISDTPRVFFQNLILPHLLYTK